MSERPIWGFHRNVFFTGLVSLFMDISSEMIYPLVPLFLTNVLNTTKTTVGIIEGIAESTASFLKIISGWLSDKFGKRKLLMGIGYGVSTASRPFMALASSWFHVLGARFIDRVGKGVRTAPRDAIIAESTERNSLGKAFGFHRSMDTVGAIIGPGIAFILLLIFPKDLRLVFMAATIPGIIAVIIIILFIKEKASKIDGAKLPKLEIASFSRSFKSYIAVIAVFSLGNFADAFIILQAENLGVRPELIPIIYLTFNMVFAASSVPLGVAADRIGLKNMVLIAFLYYALVYAGFAFAPAGAYVWFLFPLYGIYKGMSEGNMRAYLATLATAERKATAFGIYHMVNGLMLLPASIIAGYLWDSLGPSATFLFGSAMALLAAGIFIAFGRKNARYES